MKCKTIIRVHPSISGAALALKLPRLEAGGADILQKKNTVKMSIFNFGGAEKSLEGKKLLRIIGGALR